MRPDRAGGLALAGALVLFSTACAAETRVTPAAASDTPSSGPTPQSETPTPVAPAERAASVVEPEAPVLATLPSGERVPIRAVTTTRAGLLDVPANITAAGWWRGGARIGDPFGVTLVAAHVDSLSQGLGPFAELLTMPAGTRIVVGTDTLTQEFTVRSRRLVPQGPLGADSGLFDSDGARRLVLVTCAPPYDTARGGYQNLAVVTAVPVSDAERS